MWEKNETSLAKVYHERWFVEEFFRAPARKMLKQSTNFDQSNERSFDNVHKSTSCCLILWQIVCIFTKLHAEIQHEIMIKNIIKSSKDKYDRVKRTRRYFRAAFAAKIKKNKNIGETAQKIITRKAINKTNLSKGIYKDMLFEIFNGKEFTRRGCAAKNIFWSLHVCNIRTNVGKSFERQTKRPNQKTYGKYTLRASREKMEVKNTANDSEIISEQPVEQINIIANITENKDNCRIKTAVSAASDAKQTKNLQNNTRVCAAKNKKNKNVPLMSTRKQNKQKFKSSAMTI
jgi:hypothetical protein